MYDDMDQHPAVERKSGETADLGSLTQLLSRLSENPEQFLDKRAADFPAMAGVRAAANRLIESIKGAVRHRRGQGVAQTPASNDTSTTPAAHQSPEWSTPVIPLRCYVCRTLVAQPHPDYPRMCQRCGDENLARRTRSADLTGRRALVTGARVRIGYQIALKLLRAGATVEGVTRFPALAAARYAEEPDFETWSHRLTLHGVDLRQLSAVQHLATELQRPGPLDLLVNNAAQTIRLPRAHYVLLVDREQQRLQELSETARACLAPHDPHRHMTALTSQSAALFEGLPALIGAEVATSARLTQVPLLEHDLASALSSPVAWDAEGEPLDLREENSWSQTLEQVHGMELLEVHAVNALAPFLLIQALLPAFRSSPSPRRFIINVSAKEGRFYEANAARHPHTNMAKAALNMLTKTIAPELRREGIYVNSVDPGWVSDQRPFPIAEQDRDLLGDWLPLDAVDGAARILAPVWDGILDSTEPESGVLWRNYQVVPW